jgi:hypothetical protein
MKKFFIFLFGLMVIASLPAVRQYKFLNNSETTTGTVIELRSKIDKEKVVYDRFLGENSSYYPFISYQVNDKTYYLFGPENTGKLGDITEVRYQADNPAVSKVNTFMGLFFDVFFIVIIVLILIWSAVVFSFIK